jgi:hypothetical protein
VLTVQRLTKGTYFRILETSYRFIVSHARLDATAFNGVLDENRLKLGKKDLKRQEMVTFEFPQIKAIYASNLSQGKISLVISEELAVPNNEKTFKVFIHDVDVALLKRFLELMETLMKERREKIAEREKQGLEAFGKKREAKLMKLASRLPDNAVRVEQQLEMQS